ncbi:alpha/beta fold hydrolase [archaeon]|nr:alpha/beta fold hydrolase [archaeon]
MRKTVIFIILVLFIALLGCAGNEVSKPSAKASAESPAEEAPEESAAESKYVAAEATGGKAKAVKLVADDNVNLEATYCPGKENAVIFLHMMNRDRHDWDSFAKKLNLMGYTVISFDLRGHGDSDLNWMDFEDADYKPMVSDVGVAAQYIYDNNAVNIDRVYIIGASIGANLAVMYGVTDAKVKKVVMLSPGNDYHGINPLEALGKFSRPALLVYSKRDRTAADVLAMKQIGKGEREVIAYDMSTAHGTDMFKEHPELEQKMIEFISS